MSDLSLYFSSDLLKLFLISSAVIILVISWLVPRDKELTEHDANTLFEKMSNHPLQRKILNSKIGFLIDPRRKTKKTTGTGFFKRLGTLFIMICCGFIVAVVATKYERVRNLFEVKSNNEIVSLISSSISRKCIEDANIIKNDNKNEQLNMEHSDKDWEILLKCQIEQLDEISRKLLFQKIAFKYIACHSGQDNQPCQIELDNQLESYRKNESLKGIVKE